MTAPVQRISMRRALQVGWAQTVARWPPVAVLFALQAAEVFIDGERTALLAAGRSINALWAGMSTLLAAWLIAELLRVVALGGVLRQSRERLAGRACEALFPSALKTTAQTLAYWLMGLVIAIWVFAYRILALTSSGIAYVLSLIQGHHGLVASAGFALALCVCIPLGFLATLWLELALARAIAKGESYLQSLLVVAGQLWVRPWAAVGILCITGILSITSEVALSAMLNWGVWIAPGSLALSLAGRVSAGVLCAFAVTMIELSRLNAFLALQLDFEGSLPEHAASPPPLALVPSPAVVTALPLNET